MSWAGTYRYGWERISWRNWIHIAEEVANRGRQSRSGCCKRGCGWRSILLSCSVRVPRDDRAGLIGGPDVWEVVRAFPGDGDGAAGVAERMGLAPDQVAHALRYYADYRDEIDEWIRRVQAEADRAEARWRREQELLAG